MSDDNSVLEKFVSEVWFAIVSLMVITKNDCNFDIDNVDFKTKEVTSGFVLLFLGNIARMP